MSELQFCKQYLSALDSRPIKLSSDHIADPRSYPAQGAYVLPRLPHPAHPQRPNAKASAASPSANTASGNAISITLKPLKPTSPTVPLSAIEPSKTSLYDLKQSYSTSTSIPVSKIKLLYKKKLVADSKTVAEVIGPDTGDGVEFGVMVMGGATPVT
ncbi:cell-cycle control medial ring component, partial [Clohesyomyces aquaticus]